MNETSFGYSGLAELLAGGLCTDQGDHRHTIDQVTPEYWRERFATNLDRQFFVAQAVLPDMDRLGGGSIINMGSTSYLSSADSFVAYNSAKSTVVGLTRALARELGDRGIRVNCVVPGWIMTAADQALVDAGGRDGAAQATMRKAQARTAGRCEFRSVPGSRRFQRDVSAVLPCGRRRSVKSCSILTKRVISTKGNQSVVEIACSTE